MSELIRREDAFAALSNLDWYYLCKNGVMEGGAWYESYYKHDDVFMAIEEVPTVLVADSSQEDRRCKNCAHFCYLSSLHESWCCREYRDVDPNDYCSKWGEDTLDNKSINALALDVRTWNALNHNGIKTVAQIYENESTLRDIKGLGKMSYYRLNEALVRCGYRRLRNDDDTV